MCKRLLVRKQQPASMSAEGWTRRNASNLQKKRNLNCIMETPLQVERCKQTACEDLQQQVGQLPLGTDC